MTWRPNAPYNAFPPLPPVTDRFELVATGVLKDVKVGRERLFINHRFLDILTRDEAE